MSALHTNNYSSTLNGAITGSDTTIIVNSATGLPTPTGGDYFTLTLDDQAGGIEIVYVTARTGTSLTVTRGQEGTSPLNWPDLSLIEQRLTAGTIDSKITELADDPTPTAADDIDMAGNEIINALRVRANILSKDTDTTNNIEFATSRQTFKPFNVDVMNLTSAGMQLGGANTRVTTILDEDTMASNSNTALATQQSIKAYVDGSLQTSGSKAWVIFNSTGALTILDSFNISSVVDNGVGLFTVAFTAPFTNANYALSGIAQTAASNQAVVVNIRNGTAPTASAIDIQVNRDNGNAVDSDRISLVFFGDN